MSDPVVVKLQQPVKSDGQMIDALTLRRPRAIDLDTMDEAKGSHAGIRKLIARLSGVSQGAIDDLDGYDFMKASEVVNGFLSSPPSTGGQSSPT